MNDKQEVDVVCPMCSTTMVNILRMEKTMYTCFYAIVGLVILGFGFYGLTLLPAGVGALVFVVSIGVFIYIVRSAAGSKDRAWVCPRCTFGFDVNYNRLVVNLASKEQDK